MRSAFRSALWKFVVPNGAVLGGAALLLRWKLEPVFTPPAGNFIAVAICAAVILLAWRLRAPRLMLMSVLLLVAERVCSWAAHASAMGPPVSNALAILLPLNIAVLLLVDEGYFDWEAVGWWSALLGVQAVVTAAVVGLGEGSLLRHLERPEIPVLSPAGRIPQIALLLFWLVVIGQGIAFALSRKPRDSGMFWALCACLLALGTASTRLATGYFATAALIVGVSVIETAYLVGYHDELTGLPARRSFNQAIAALDGEYSIAMVDIDHFKQFNDTFGHDVGDQVLRMVASHLAHAGGDSKTFRYGGEEFAIIFRRTAAEEALVYAEELRQSIAEATFVVRGLDRSERNRKERRQHHSKRRLRKQRFDTRVTVSMGVAEPAAPDMPVADVIQAADKALYRAKERGRNRVELYGGGPDRAEKPRLRVVPRRPLA